MPMLTPQDRREAAIGQLEALDDLIRKLPSGDHRDPKLEVKIQARAAAANTAAVLYVGDQIDATRQDARDALNWVRDEAAPLAHGMASVVKSALISGGTVFMNAMKAIEGAGAAVATASDRIANHHTGN
jgi:hypothetical protein